MKVSTLFLPSLEADSTGMIELRTNVREASVLLFNVIENEVILEDFILANYSKNKQ